MFQKEDKCEIKAHFKILLTGKSCTLSLAHYRTIKPLCLLISVGL